MPLMRDDGVVAPRGGRGGGVNSVGNFGSHLSAEFFVRLRAKPHRGVLVDHRWCLDNELEFSSLWSQWDGKDKGHWGRIESLLATAPGLGAITLLRQMVMNPKDTLFKSMQALGKGDDEEEDAKRQRDAKERFDVIGQLVDVGRPVPLWLDRSFRLDEGAA